MELKIEYLSPKELTPYKGNARKHEREDLEQIKESIRVDGFNDPIGIWGAENLIWKLYNSESWVMRRLSRSKYSKGEVSKKTASFMPSIRANCKTATFKYVG